MKKYSFMLVLLFLSMLTACGIIGSEPVLESNENETPLVPIVVENEAREITFDVQTARDFNVTPADHGYIGVALIEQLNDEFPNRLAFSNRELETAEWLVATLLEMGFDPAQIQTQTFHIDTPTSSWWGRPQWMIDMYAEMGYYDGLTRIDSSQNVILTLPGRSDETIIMGAHYDGVGNPGVSDNASGTVLLLENAYRMQHVDHYYTLQYVFFGAEEVGLVGSFYFADQMTDEAIENLVLMINADVIMDGPDLIYAIGYLDDVSDLSIEILWESPDISQNATSTAIKSLAEGLNEHHGTGLISLPHALLLPSDQLAFLSFGRPVMVFYATHPVVYPETFIGDVLHTPDDNLDFIMENHPGRIERALLEFGLFLEAVTTSDGLMIH